MAQKLALGLLSILVAVQMMQATPLLQNIFNAADINPADGELSMESGGEVDVYLKAQVAAGLGTQEQLEEIEACLADADTGGNGSIDFGEFEAAMEVATAKKK